MLSDPTATRIRQIVEDFWTQHVTDPSFVALTGGKEVGHSIANYVDERTCALLDQHFTTTRQNKADGKPRDRSMGDIWIQDAGIWHSVNVKAGLAGSESHPNIVSLKKLVRALASRQVDSYWLLIVKVDLRPQTPTAAVDLVNALDYLAYVSYNSGPGQLMLRARAFMKDRAQGVGQAPRTPVEAHAWLMETRRVQFEKFCARWEEDTRELEAEKAAFYADPTAPLDQSGLHLA